MNKWDRLKATGNKTGLSGVNLMNQLAEGKIEVASSEYVEQVRDKVVESLGELIDIGARIRPLLIDDKQVGWVRAIHNTERRILQRWLYRPNDYLTTILKTATTLTEEEITNLSGLEIRNLVQVVKTMSEADVSIYPYLSAFVTSIESENLWHGKGQAAFEDKIVILPDGKTMKIIRPSDHARLWATLATYREQTKKRLEENWNAILIVRPWAGKSVDPLSNEIRKLTKRMQTGSMEPWKTIIRTPQDSVNVNDGWGHAFTSDSPESLMREMGGMLTNDKHEQVMAKFEADQIAAAQALHDQARKAMSREVGVTSEVVEVISAADAMHRERELKKGSFIPVGTRDQEVVTDPREKIKRYR